MAAGRLGINHHGPSSGGQKTLAFDLMNGAIGPLNACLAASHWIIAGRASRALVLASEVENNARFGQDALIGLREMGSALLLAESKTGEGFGRFVFRAVPEHVADIRAVTAICGAPSMVKHKCSPDWERHAACGLQLAVNELHGARGASARRHHARPTAIGLQPIRRTLVGLAGLASISFPRLARRSSRLLHVVARLRLPDRSPWGASPTGGSRVDPDRWVRGTGGMLCVSLLGQSQENVREKRVIERKACSWL